jgi:hypothetical protein
MLAPANDQHAINDDVKNAGWVLMRLFKRCPIQNSVGIEYY